MRYFKFEKLVRDNIVSQMIDNNQEPRGTRRLDDDEFITELIKKVLEEVEEMKRIASDFGVHMNVGEINFSFSDSKQGEKLEEAIDLTKQEGLVSYIYPGVNVA